MPLDPSIPLQAKTVQNPFEQIAQPIQVAQGLQALKQSQMQLGANQAISQAYSQSLNPDGSVDFNKLQSLAGQNGAGAYLPQFMAQIATQRNQQQQYDTSKLDMDIKRQQALNGMITGLLYDPDLGKTDFSDKIASQIVQAQQNGYLPMEQAIREIKNIPGDPGMQKAWITNHAANSQNGIASLQALLNQNIAVDTGSGTVLLNRNPLTGESTVGTTVQKGLSPSELSQTVTVVGPNGEQRAITKAQFLQMQGGGGVPGAPAGGAPGGYTGRNDGSSQGVPGIQTSLGPAQQTALAAQGTTSNNAAQALSNESENIPLQLQTLRSAREALANIQTGPTTEFQNRFKSALQSTPGLGTIVKAMGVDPQKIASYDEFKKLMTNFASQQSGASGTGTDARLNAAITGNANPSISNLANDDILAKTQAALSMKAAKNLAFQNSGLTTDQYNKWSSQWNKNVAPEPFAFAEMNPTQRQSFLSRQSPEQLTKFKADLGNLVRNGIIQMPGQ